jgi:hypothetical protein
LLAEIVNSDGHGDKGKKKAVQRMVQFENVLLLFLQEITRYIISSLSSFQLLSPVRVYPLRFNCTTFSI